MIQKLPGLHGNNGEHFRPETGPMQFGDDWPGVFIRGDNALADANMIEMALKMLPEELWTLRAMLMGLMNTLRSCKVGETGWPPGA